MALLHVIGTLLNLDIFVSPVHILFTSACGFIAVRWLLKLLLGYVVVPLRKFLYHRTTF
jgi:hypothetical protein